MFLCTDFVPVSELPGFRGRAPRRRGSGQANKAERTGAACRGDSWSDLAWERGGGRLSPPFYKMQGGTTMLTDNKSEIVIFKTADEKISVDVRFEGETVWLTQAQLVDLYGSSKANVSEHIKHIFEEEELEEDSVVRNFRTAAADGKSYQTKYYNLDMIISLGYRIKSKIATQFRQWATKRLNEYI